MYVLFVKMVPKPWWQMFVKRDLNWKPLSDAKPNLPVTGSGPTPDRGWWYSFKTKAQAENGRKVFKIMNAAEAATFTTCVRERKTMLGLDT